MLEKEFQLEVVTPERTVVSETADMLVVPAWNGELGILKNHAPLVAAVRIGLMRMNVSGLTRFCATSGGWLEVTENKVMVLADTAEFGSEVDIERARAAKARAEARLSSQREDVNMVRAQMALTRATARLKAAEEEMEYRKF